MSRLSAQSASKHQSQRLRNRVERGPGRRRRAGRLASVCLTLGPLLCVGLLAIANTPTPNSTAPAMASETNDASAPALKTGPSTKSRIGPGTGTNSNVPPEGDERTPATPREYANAGTARLRQGKLREAESLFESALSMQRGPERVQTTALYNLGHVRFGQGAEELKKGPAAGPTAARGRAAAHLADVAIQNADEALAGTEVQKLVAAYMQGRGVRRELREAMKAVQKGLQTYGAALRKWQRASGDFKSALELNPADQDARHNADVVDRSIAKLIDSIQEMQQAANAMGDKAKDLGDKMKQMKGRIPAEDMPPGAAGEDEEEEQPQGPKPGEEEGKGKEGEEMTLSPEQASWLLEGFRLDSDRRLPMGEKDTAEPRNRNRPTW